MNTKQTESILPLRYYSKAIQQKTTYTQNRSICLETKIITDKVKAFNTRMIKCINYINLSFPKKKLSKKFIRIEQGFPNFYFNSTL